MVLFFKGLLLLWLYFLFHLVFYGKKGKKKKYIYHQQYIYYTNFFFRYYGEYILLWMGQDPQLASMAQIYLYFAIPALLPTFISTAIRKFVQSLGKMKITMYMVIVIFPLNHLVDHILLSKLDIGMYGVSLQNTLFHLIVLIVYGSFLYYGTDFKKKYWPGFTKEAFYHWHEFLKLGIPGMLSVSTDWAFEVCALITGVLGETNLAAQNVVISVNSFLIMIPT